MPRLPYEVVMIEANRLIIQMALAPNWYRADFYWELYIAYITACGWTDWEFDQETLRRIDASWDNRRWIQWN